MRKSPAFTSVAVMLLALGIGANTAIFSFVNAILLKQLPVPHADRLMQLHDYENNQDANDAYSLPLVRELSRRNQVFSGVLGRFTVRASLGGHGTMEPLHAEVVTGGYFDTLSVKPALGRLLTENDVRSAPGDPVCVIRYGFWQQRFGGDPAILGSKLELNGHLYRVIGVTEPGFRGSQLQPDIDVQVPVSRVSDFMGGAFASGGITWESAGFSWLEVLGRLKPGMTPARAQAMLQPLMRQIRLDLADPAYRKRVAAQESVLRLTDGRQGFNGNREALEKPITVLMAVVGMMLLIACANIATLLLARGSARENEFAVRRSLGATRARLLRQLLAESVLIAVVGGVLGLVVSYWIVDTLLFFFNSGTEPSLRVTPDATVLCFAMAATVGTAILFGFAPAWHLASQDLSAASKDAVRATARRNTSLFRSGLIAFQISLSLVMLFAAGLLIRTLRGLETVDLGFQPAGIVALTADPGMVGYSSARASQFYDEILDRLHTMPGIAAAALTTVSPLEGSAINLMIEVPGAQRNGTQSAFNTISPGYFATLNQKLLAGRDFSNRDVEGRQRVAIVNERFVNEFLRGHNPLGMRFKIGGGEVEIVGVVETAKYQQMREAPQPLVYAPIKQAQSSGYTLLARGAAGVKNVAPLVEQSVHSADPKIPVYNVRSLEAQIEHGISSERILGFLSTLFGALATLLCAIGLYGVMAYAVSRRTREIGVRFAIGAQKRDVAKLFLRDSAAVIAVGIGIGIPVALACARFLGSLLYGLKAADVPTLIVVSVILVAAGSLATALPVRRAAAIEPVEALRHE